MSGASNLPPLGPRPFPSPVTTGFSTPNRALDPAYAAYQREQDKQQEDRFWQDLAQQAGKNRDLEAELIKFGVQLDAPPEALRENIQLARDFVMLREMKLANLRESAPVLYEQLSNPEFASLALDDWETLTWTEQLGRGFTAGDLETELGELMTEVMEGRKTLEEVAKRRNELNDVLDRLHVPSDSLWGQTAKTVGQLYEWETLGNLAALVPRAGMPVAALINARQAYEVEGGLALNEYLRAGVDLQTAINNSIAVGLINAGVEAGGFYVAALPFKAAAGNIIRRSPAMRRLTTRLVGNALKGPVAKRALTVTAARIVGQVATETLIEEPTQESVTAIFQRRAIKQTQEKLNLRAPGTKLELPGGGTVEVIADGTVAVDPEVYYRVTGKPVELDRTEPFILDEGIAASFVNNLNENVLPAELILSDKAFWADMWNLMSETAETAFYGTVLLGATGPTIQHFSEKKRVARAAKQRETYEQLVNKVKDVRLKQSQAGALALLFRRQWANSDLKEVHVDRERFQEILDKSDVTLDELEEVFPGIKEQLQQSGETNPTIVLDGGTFFSELAETDFQRALLDDIKPTPGDLSNRQAREKQEQIKQEAKALSKSLKSVDKMRAEREDDSLKLAKQLVDSAVAAGVNPRVARDSIALWSVQQKRLAEQISKNRVEKGGQPVTPTQLLEESLPEGITVKDLVVDEGRLALSGQATANRMKMFVGTQGFKRMQGLMTRAYAARYETAQKMGRDGATSEEIRKATGWFIGHDGMPRYEITDDSVTLSQRPTRRDDSLGGTPLLKLNEVLDLADLMLDDWYPVLREIEVEADDQLDDDVHGEVRTTVDGDGNRKTVIAVDPDLTDKELLSTLLHEVQHVVQTEENFARGGSPEQFAGAAYQEEFEQEFVDAVFARGGFGGYFRYLRSSQVFFPGLSDVENKLRKYYQLLRLSRNEAAFGDPKKAQVLYAEAINMRAQARVAYEKLDPAAAQGEAASIDADVVRSEFQKTAYRLQALAEAAPKRSLPAADGGGTPLTPGTGEVRSPADDEFTYYRRLYGEVEARATEERRALTEEEREATPPFTSEDVSPMQMIFMFNSVEQYGGRRDFDDTEFPDMADDGSTQDPASRVRPLAESRPMRLDPVSTPGVQRSARRPKAKFADEKSTPPAEYKLSKEDKEKLKALKAQVPGISRVLKDLNDDEIATLLYGRMTRGQTMLDILSQMPSTNEMAAVALSGRAKRGWYARSAEALRIVFGEDAPRFAALLAALSPQTSVESNLINTLNAWGAWVKAGRPTTDAEVLAILGKTVQGSGTEKSVLDAWRNNAYRALTQPDPTRIVLSGPKVNSFMLNLLGQFDESTNDAWMANYTNLDQALFGADGTLSQNGLLPGKSPGYLAMTVATRRAGKKLGWSTAEIQETIWSWAKALMEKAENRQTTSVELLTSGNLLHEDINSVPDFELLFNDPEFAPLLEKAGYGDKLESLKEAASARDTEQLTGSAFDEANEALLKRAAKRLDKLAAHRAFLATRRTVMVNLTASTMSIPGLAQLTEKARAGDVDAARDLQEITIDALKYLMSNIKKVQLEFTPTTGMYSGTTEPSVGLSLSFLERDRDQVLAALKQFAQNFDQEQFHLRVGGTGRLAKTFDDGSFNTRVFTFKLKEPLSEDEAERVLSEAGLPGLTMTDDAVEVYYAGDPTDDEALRQFEVQALQLRKLLGRNGSTAVKSVDRVWVYGDRSTGGRIGFDQIQGKFRPPTKDQASATAQRVATRLAKREIEGVPRVEVITEDQRSLQERIRDAYEAMVENNLADPNVKRAYEELAVELIEQYEALPVKIEVWTDDDGQPYPGVKQGKVFLNQSEQMRQDVLANNHLYIYKTDVGKFGRPGVDYTGHPMLEPTDYTDINGVPLVVNDLLRAVHDYFAHSMSEVGFGPLGEEAAWRNHMQMTRSPWARWALTTETRGQNSWVNFREEVKDTKLSERGFADQKADLLPLEFIVTGDPTVDASLSKLPGSEGLPFTEQEEGVVSDDDAATKEQSDAARDNKPTADPDDRLQAQSAVEGTLGEFDRRTFQIIIGKKHTAATLTHELTHLHFEQLIQLYKRGELSDQQIADLETLVTQTGDFQSLDDYVNAPFDERHRKVHEQVAHKFEVYLRKGEAPTPGLRKLFGRMLKWFKRTYADMRRISENYQAQFGVPLPALTEDVKLVFDRWFAAEEEIDIRNRELMLSRLLLNQDLDPLDKLFLEELIFEHEQTAKEKLRRVFMRELRTLRRLRNREFRKLQREHKKERTRVETEERVALLRESKLARMLHFLSTGELLDAEGNVIDTFAPQKVAHAESELEAAIALQDDVKQELAPRQAEAAANQQRAEAEIKQLIEAVRYHKESRETVSKEIAAQKKSGVPNAELLAENENVVAELSRMIKEAEAEILEQRKTRDDAKAELRQFARELKEAEALVDKAITLVESMEKLGAAGKSGTKMFLTSDERVPERYRTSDPKAAMVLDVEGFAREQGFVSASQMFDALRVELVGAKQAASEFITSETKSAPKRNVAGEALQDMVDERADRRMLAEMPHLADPEEMQNEIDNAMTTEALLKLRAAEVNLLEKRMPAERELLATAKQVAKEVVGKLKLSELFGRQNAIRKFLQAAQRAELEAAKGVVRVKQADGTKTTEVRRGDIEKVNELKRTALMQRALAAEALARRNQIVKQQAKLEKQLRYSANNKRETRLSQTYGGPFVESARWILNLMGVDVGSGLRESNPDTWRPWDKMADDDPAKAELQLALDDADLILAEHGELREQSVEQAVETLFFVEGLVMRGKQLQNLSHAEREATVQELIDELKRRVQQERAPRRQKKPKTWWAKAWAGLRKWRSATQRLEQVLYAMDGDSFGMLSQLLFAPVRDGEDTVELTYAKVAAKLVDLLKPVRDNVGSSKELHEAITGDIGEDGKPLLQDPDQDGPHVFQGGKLDILGVLLHSGNESNLKRLLLGFGWAQYDEDGNVDTSRFWEQVSRWEEAGVITKEDWAFVQGVWDVYESDLLPMTQQAHMEMLGREMEIVQRGGAEMERRGLAGGYVPASPEPTTRTVKGQTQAQENLLGFMRMIPAVQKGHTLKRVQQPQPDPLDINPLNQLVHFRQQIIFAVMGPVHRRVAHALRNNEVAELLEQLNPDMYQNLLKHWLEAATNLSSTMVDTRSNDLLSGLDYILKIRSNYGTAAMFFNVVNSLQGVTGLILARARVKAKHMAFAMADAMRSGGMKRSEIYELSDFMKVRHRLGVSAFELQQDIVGLVKGEGPLKLAALKRWIAKNTYIAQEAIQFPVDLIVWRGAFDEALAAGMEQGQAVAAADSAVRQTQSDTAVISMARGEKGNTFSKLFTQFSSWFLALGSLSASPLRRATLEDRALREQDANLARRAASMGATIAFSKEAIAGFLSLYVGELIMDQFTEKEDDEPVVDFAGSLYQTALAIPRAFGPATMAASTFIATLSGAEPFQQRMPAPAPVAILGQLASRVRELYDGDELESADFADLVETISMAFGIPIQVVSQRLRRGLNILDEDDIEPRIGGLITGRR